MGSFAQGSGLCFAARISYIKIRSPARIAPAGSRECGNGGLRTDIVAAPAAGARAAEMRVRVERNSIACTVFLTLSALAAARFDYPHGTHD